MLKIKIKRKYIVLSLFLVSFLSIGMLIYLKNISASESMDLNLPELKALEKRIFI